MKNETILINYNGVTFSENVFAFFTFGEDPIISNCLEDLCLPEDYVEQYVDGHYEIFGFNEDAQQHLYTGRLYKAKKKIDNVIKFSGPFFDLGQ
jgi:hypothetical protein